MHKLESDFELIELTPQELQAAYEYSHETRAMLKNLLGELAHRKINLKLDPSRITEFIQEEAYLAAQIDLLRFLLSNREQQGKGE